MLRSCRSGAGILPCKILISPRPLTTPRSALTTKSNQNCAELMCRIIDHGQSDEGTTPRSGLLGSNCHLARSCSFHWLESSHALAFAKENYAWTSEVPFAFFRLFYIHNICFQLIFSYCPFQCEVLFTLRFNFRSGGVLHTWPALAERVLVASGHFGHLTIYDVCQMGAYVQSQCFQLILPHRLFQIEVLQIMFHK